MRNPLRFLHAMEKARGGLSDALDLPELTDAMRRELLMIDRRLFVLEELGLGDVRWKAQRETERAEQREDVHQEDLFS